MYSDTVKDHIYTISVFEEGGYLFAPQGYVAQTLNAALLFRFATDASSLVPLYHLYQSATQTNLYTADASLRQTLLTVAQPPYTDATFPGSIGSIAIEAYVYPDGSCPGTVPLLWASNSLITDNYYTIDTAEYNSVVANGYTPMGPVGWVYPVRKCLGIVECNILRLTSLGQHPIRKYRKPIRTNRRQEEGIGVFKEYI